MDDTNTNIHVSRDSNPRSSNQTDKTNALDREATGTGHMRNAKKNLLKDQPVRFKS